jgi:hypothetical protein
VSEYAVRARPPCPHGLRQLGPATRKEILAAMRTLGIYDVDDTARTVTVAVVGRRREVYRSLDH